MVRERDERRAKADEWTRTHELLAAVYDRLGLIATTGWGFKKPPEPLQRPWQKDHKPKGMSALSFARAMAAAGKRKGR